MQQEKMVMVPECESVAFDFEYSVHFEGREYQMKGFRATSGSPMTYAFSNGTELARFRGEFTHPDQAVCLLVGWASGRWVISSNHMKEFRDSLRLDLLRQILSDELAPIRSKISELARIFLPPL